MRGVVGWWWGDGGGGVEHVITMCAAFWHPSKVHKSITLVSVIEQIVQSFYSIYDLIPCLNEPLTKAPPEP